MTPPLKNKNECNYTYGQTGRDIMYSALFRFNNDFKLKHLYADIVPVLRKLIPFVHMQFV